MPQHSIDTLKLHIGLPISVTEDDVLIEEYSAAAEMWVQDHLRRDLDAEFPAGWPFPCKQAVKLMVADFYDARGVVGDGINASRAASLLASYRDLS